MGTSINIIKHVGIHFKGLRVSVEDDKANWFQYPYNDFVFIQQTPKGLQGNVCTGIKVSADIGMSVAMSRSVM